MIEISKIINKSSRLLLGLLTVIGILGTGFGFRNEVKAADTFVPKKIIVNVGSDETNVGISFETPLGVTDAKVVVSLNETLTSPVEILAKSTEVSGTTASGPNVVYLAWGAYVTELTPDTTYYYKVGNDNGWSSTLSFTTLKTSGDATMLFFGDVQGGYAAFPNVLDKAVAQYPEASLFMLAGDINDSEARLYDEITSFDNYAKTYLNNNIWAAAIGNHDAYNGGHVFSNYFYGPNNGIDSGSGVRNYYFEFNDAIIFNLDTEAGFASYDPAYVKQSNLLRTVMNETTKKYKIVLMHRSTYPMNYNEANVRALSSVFEELEIDLVISGHDHVYNRTTMLEGNKVEVNNGVTYVVGGSSGTKFYNADTVPRPWENIVYDDNFPVFSAIRFSNGNLLFSAHSIVDNRVSRIDNFTISKFDVNLTKSEGIDLKGSLYARNNDTITYTVDTLDGYLFDYVKVNGKIIELVDNQFTVENITKQTTIEISATEINKPIALELDIVGNLITGNTLQASYVYYDPSENNEGESIISWYVNGLKVYEGDDFLIDKAYAGKKIEVRVTAVSTAETGFERYIITEESVKLFGDLNGDFVVTKEDAIMILQAINGRFELTEQQKLLVGVVDKPTLADARTLLALIGGN
ncbi:MAG: metallophosphoesterase family protein [Acholeplasmataceae bacterium]|nr:metallophosphoesterase family protein [Acholeplasmataceae bacterium]